MENKLYNLKIAVKNLEESWNFYKTIFKPLGFNDGRAYDDPLDKRTTVVLGNKQMYLELAEWPDLVPQYDLNTLAGPRIEFKANSKDEVDLFYKHLLENGVKILSKPEYLFQDILDGEDDYWYATYFADPSGIKIGLVHTPK